ncbi:hypothetical protein BGZ65_002023 [Modicella reniformis]|uniref:SWIM-type domain-containing protein n=1 Tax=Modicella reniformis TaxID=1440133 RepID=A0A9P6J124_9FUNG|nr:hypothetical protein BGZ65_002023 [Modicella reniformis]
MLLLSETESDVSVALRRFANEYESHRIFSSFWEDWLKTLDAKLWMKAFRIDVEHGELDITNALVGWHRTFMFNSRDGELSRRRDVLIHMLFEREEDTGSKKSVPQRYRTKGSVSRDLEGDQRRQERALSLMEGIQKISKGCWSVPSSGGDKWYKVKRPQKDIEFTRCSCTCEDFRRRKRKCKHIFAVLMYHTKQGPDLDTIEAAVETEIDFTEANTSMVSVIGLESSDSEADISMVSTAAAIDFLEDVSTGEQEIHDPVGDNVATGAQKIIDFVESNVTTGGREIIDLVEDNVAVSAQPTSGSSSTSTERDQAS